MVSKNPTIREVAKMAGVSIQTVSNTLNNPAVVKDSTRDRVEKAIAALHYQVDASARRLRTGKSYNVGVCIGPPEGNFSGAIFDRFLHALSREAITAAKESSSSPPAASTRRSSNTVPSCAAPKSTPSW